MVSIDTLGALVDRGYALWAHCMDRECGRSVELDLPLLVERLGPDYSSLAMHLGPRLRCGACGGRAIMFSLIADAYRKPA